MTHPDEAPMPARRPRLLVVDDEPVFGSALRRALVDDYTVELASDPEEAVVMLANAPRSFDVVLCDLWMPSLSGPRLRDRLRERSDETPCFVFMTGALPELARQLVGAEPLVLHKPFSVAELREVLVRAIVRAEEA
jgi:CheY-like chemotaxis protein